MQTRVQITLPLVTRGNQSTGQLARGEHTKWECTKMTFPVCIKTGRRGVCDLHAGRVDDISSLLFPLD